jgi:CheY-like chemotaxis protein
MPAFQTIHTETKPLATLSRPEPPVAPVVIDAPKEMAIPVIAKPETIPPPTLEIPFPSGQKQLSLLLVEDNPINLKLLIASFKKMGHAYSTATDGSQAVATYRNADSTRSPRFNIVFMDIQMPVMDGMEASLQIRKYEKMKGLQPAIIIALTALTSLQAEQEALDAGADRFMSKPISIKKLRDVVGEYFRDERERDQKSWMIP